MKEFIDLNERVVSAESRADADQKFMSLSANETWHVTVAASGIYRGSDGLSEYKSPTGEKYRAGSLVEARAMHSNGGRKSGAHSAAAPNRPALAFDKASSMQVFAARDKIYKGSGTSVDDIMNKTAEYHQLVANASAHR